MDDIRFEHLLCDPHRVIYGKDGTAWRFTCASKADNVTTHICTGYEHRIPGFGVWCTCPCHKAYDPVPAGAITDENLKVWLDGQEQEDE